MKTKVSAGPGPSEALGETHLVFLFPTLEATPFLKSEPHITSPFMLLSPSPLVL